jgi:hypothetical protein
MGVPFPPSNGRPDPVQAVLILIIINLAVSLNPKDNFVFAPTVAQLSLL